MDNNIGPKRLVVGAHYGLRDWLAQRATAIVMAVFTIVLLVLFLGAGEFRNPGRVCMLSNGSNYLRS